MANKKSAGGKRLTVTLNRGPIKNPNKRNTARKRSADDNHDNNNNNNNNKEDRDDTKSPSTSSPSAGVGPLGLPKPKKPKPKSASTSTGPEKSTQGLSRENQARTPTPTPTSNQLCNKPSEEGSSPGSVPHRIREGASRGTRSAHHQELFSTYAWEAPGLRKPEESEEAIASTTSTAITPTISQGSAGRAKAGAGSVELTTTNVSTCSGTGTTTAAVSSAAASSAAKLYDKRLNNMSRNRPRGPPVPRDNGLAVNEETDMWNKILQDLRKAKEKNDKQKALAEQIAALNEGIASEGNKPTLAQYNQLEGLYGQLSKLCEEERSILQEEPSDVIKNLDLLTALRQASEAEAPMNRFASLQKSRKKKNEADGSATDSPAPPNASVPDKLSRVKGSVQRSTSVPGQARENREGRENVIVKVEEGTEGAKGTAAERNGLLVIGAEVVFKHNKNKQGIEGEGIQCIIKNITGEGTKKRYDVQDPEPNENGEQGAVYKTSAASLIPIPRVGSALPLYPSGKQVLARYPDTTTFYRAEVMGSKKDVYRLKFEGEEDDKEMEVDKRFVLDILGK